MGSFAEGVGDRVPVPGEQGVGEGVGWDETQRPSLVAGAECPAGDSAAVDAGSVRAEAVTDVIADVAYHLDLEAGLLAQLSAQGSVWLLASLGVFLRDISQVVGVLTTALLFLSPIFYPASRIPEWLQPYYAWNPIAVLVETFRSSVFAGAWPDCAALACGVGLLAYAANVCFSPESGRR